MRFSGIQYEVLPNTLLACTLGAFGDSSSNWRNVLPFMPTIHTKHHPLHVGTSAFEVDDVTWDLAHVGISTVEGVAAANQWAPRRLAILFNRT